MGRVGEGVGMSEGKEDEAMGRASGCAWAWAWEGTCALSEGKPGSEALIGDVSLAMRDWETLDSRHGGILEAGQHRWMLRA
jgi:hypothetical protein